MNRKPIRPVTVASVCGPNGTPEEILALAKTAAAQQPDLILLHECWADTDESSGMAMLPRLRALAAEYGTYIVHPLRLADKGRTYNSALVIDRRGEITGRYDKAYPYWDEILSEERADGIFPGALRQPVMDCDFGKIAVMICFDANFPQVWANAAEQGAELVLWPSAYGAGMQLAAHALNYHYPIVTATSSGHCTVFDLDGERTVNVHHDRPFVQWVTLDLDRCIFHENFNTEKLQQLLAEKPPRLEVEKHLPAEQWIIVRSAMEGVSAKTVCKNAGMEELRAYKTRSLKQIDAIRENGMQKG